MRVEYHLTEMGQELRPVLDELVAWSHKWIPLPESETESAVTLNR
ncbi:winged helix-turn-helix transcriptional regulator [Nonomuraea candida]|nr:winged helix-turn-helix transcriptional regulator [Nonomuraea candida]